MTCVKCLCSPLVWVICIIINKFIANHTKQNGNMISWFEPFSTVFIYMIKTRILWDLNGCDPSWKKPTILTLNAIPILRLTCASLTSDSTVLVLSFYISCISFKYIAFLHFHIHTWREISARIIFKHKIQDVGTIHIIINTNTIVKCINIAVNLCQFLSLS